MNYQDFRDSIKKVSGKRNHLVTNSYGVYDAYKDIRKNKWFNIGRPLKEGEFYKIIRSINKYLALELSSGKEIKLPHRLGTIEIRKKPRHLAIIDGKLVTNLPIDWDATLKLWYEDEECFKTKQKVYCESMELFKIFYNKHEAEYTNKSFFEFNPNREIKIAISKRAKEGNLEAFLLNKHYGKKY